MTTLILVRHGQTVWHAENRYTGRSDIDLTDEGHRQAKALANWAAVARPDALVCSPTRRTRDTAAPIAAALGTAPRIVPALREIDFGSAEGRTIDELPLSVADAFRADPAAHFFPGGEPPDRAAGRCVRALTDLATELDGATVLVVAHSTLLRLGLCQLLGIPLRHYRTVFPEIKNCALTTVRLDQKGTALLNLNVPTTER